MAYEDKVIKSRGMVYGTFTTVGGSEDEKQQPEPEADVEVEGGAWESFLCERPPLRLIGATMKQRLRVCEATGRLDASDIAELISIDNSKDICLRPRSVPKRCKTPSG